MDPGSCLYMCIFCVYILAYAMFIYVVTIIQQKEAINLKVGGHSRDSRESTGEGLEGEGEGRSDVTRFQFKCIKINHKEKPE